MNEMTISEFEELLNKAYDLKLEAEAIDEKKKEKERELSELNRIILSEFERLNKTSYSTGRCSIIRVQKPTVTIPKEPEAREAFFNYLKSKQIFEGLVTVNHQTLNGFYKQELEAAIEAGDHSFKIPGLDAPKMNEYISFRKK